MKDSGQLKALTDQGPDRRSRHAQDDPDHQGARPPSEVTAAPSGSDAPPGGPTPGGVALQARHRPRRRRRGASRSSLTLVTWAGLRAFDQSLRDRRSRPADRAASSRSRSALAALVVPAYGARAIVAQPARPPPRRARTGSSTRAPRPRTRATTCSTSSASGSSRAIVAFGAFFLAAQRRARPRA